MMRMMDAAMVEALARAGWTLDASGTLHDETGEPLGLWDAALALDVAEFLSERGIYRPAARA